MKFYAVHEVSTLAFRQVYSIIYIQTHSAMIYIEDDGLLNKNGVGGFSHVPITAYIHCHADYHLGWNKPKVFVLFQTLLQASRAPGTPPGLTETMFEFWLMILTSCKNWHTNHDVCQVLDATLEAALVCHKASNVLTQEIFMTHFRVRL